MARPPLDRGKSALVVWDISQGIAGRAYDRAEIVARTREMLDDYRSRGLPLVYRQHTILPSRWTNPMVARSV
ncbi:MAG: hypothetical protein ACREB9_08355, partial [Thermoplasmata archaeon]